MISSTSPASNGHSDEYPAKSTKLMQADGLPDYRGGRPMRCELPPHRG
jgi:hypothetical protein